MKIKSKIILSIIIFFFSACTNYNVNKQILLEEKKFYSSSGFALIYDNDLYEQKIINKRLNNDQTVAFHSLLKRNTLIKITNPFTSKSVNAKIVRRASYPKLFNLVITKKIASILELDPENPYIEFSEIKKNITFIAKKANTFEEEKNVAAKVPVNEIEMDNLSQVNLDTNKKLIKKNNFVIFISDFYYLDSANNLKQELVKQTKIDNFSVKKINNNQYRLQAGPFKDFNALKLIYVSLNNLGFDELNVYRK